MSDVVLSLQNISKDYRQGRSTISVLNNINLQVRQAELVGIVGASGRGKSTLLHIAGLLDFPSQGSVQILGEELSLKKDPSKCNMVRLNHLGFIYQQHHLQRDFTAIENVAMPLMILGKDSKFALEQAKILLHDLGLQERLYSFPGVLSGGEQQRVAIARALINKPKVIFADEPTGNLDPATAEEVFQILLEQVKKYKSSVVMVSHNMELASRMDRVIEL